MNMGETIASSNAIYKNNFLKRKGVITAIERIQLEKFEKVIAYLGEDCVPVTLFGWRDTSDELIGKSFEFNLTLKMWGENCRNIELIARGSDTNMIE